MILITDSRGPWGCIFTNRKNDFSDEPKICWLFKLEVPFIYQITHEDHQGPLNKKYRHAIIWDVPLKKPLDLNMKFVFTFRLHFVLFNHNDKPVNAVSILYVYRRERRTHATLFILCFFPSLFYPGLHIYNDLHSAAFAYYIYICTTLYLQVNFRCTLRFVDAVFPYVIVFIIHVLSFSGSRSKTQNSDQNGIYPSLSLTLQSAKFFPFKRVLKNLYLGVENERRGGKWEGKAVMRQGRWYWGEGVGTATVIQWDLAEPCNIKMH